MNHCKGSTRTLQTRYRLIPDHIDNNKKALSQVSAIQVIAIKRVKMTSEKPQQYGRICGIPSLFNDKLLFEEETQDDTLVMLI